MKEYKTIDEYISQFPSDVAKKLVSFKKTIQEVAPQATEAIKYGIPTFTLNGNLVHFAAYTSHIGFYPTPSAIEHFKKELSDYKMAKGSIQFPLNTPLPFPLIRRIVEYRVKQNISKAKNK